MKLELIRTDARSLKTTMVRKLPVLIGRDTAADVQLDDYWVAPRQCLIQQTSEGPVVCDLGTRTGTFVNGRRVAQALLRPGDKLSLGRTELLVCFVPAEGDTASRERPISAKPAIPQTKDTERWKGRRPKPAQSSGKSLFCPLCLKIS